MPIENIDRHLFELKRIVARVSAGQTQTHTIYPAFPDKAEAIQEFIDLFAEHLPAGGRLLDIGACDGYLARAVAERLPGVVALSCDCNPQNEMVKKTALPDLHYFHEDFNVVTSRHCLEHSLTLSLDLLEIRRILKPGGILAVVVPDIYDSIILEHPNHVNILPREAWRKVFRIFGFEILRDVDGIWKASKDMREWRFILRKLELPL